MKEYVVVDLETTGLDPYKGCEIIEIGITEIKNEQIVKNYSRLIKPKGIISSFIKYIGDRTIIAHNAKFDLKFLNYYLRMLNLEPINNYICTVELLKKCKSYKGKNKKLETACAYYNIENINAHRADSDTLATAKLFLKIKDEY